MDNSTYQRNLEALRGYSPALQRDQALVASMYRMAARQNDLRALLILFDSCGQRDSCINEASIIMDTLRRSGSEVMDDVERDFVAQLQTILRGLPQGLSSEAIVQEFDRRAVGQFRIVPRDDNELQAAWGIIQRSYYEDVERTLGAYLGQVRNEVGQGYPFQEFDEWYNQSNDPRFEVYMRAHEAIAVSENDYAYEDHGVELPEGASNAISAMAFWAFRQDILDRADRDHDIQLDNPLQVATFVRMQMIDNEHVRYAVNEIVTNVFEEEHWDDFIAIEEPDTAQLRELLYLIEDELEGYTPEEVDAVLIELWQLASVASEMF